VAHTFKPAKILNIETDVISGINGPRRDDVGYLEAQPEGYGIKRCLILLVFYSNLFLNLASQ
jgi:hypothetical protein